MPARIIRWFALVVVVVAPACTGKVGALDVPGPGNPGTGGVGAAGSGGPGGGGLAGGGADGGAPAGCQAVGVPTAPLRRLTRSEYRYSVDDLFAGLPLPALTLSADPTKDGFTNNAGMQSPSGLLVTEYNESAVAIAGAVAPALVSKLGCTASAACFRSFVGELGRQAFRRPLTTGELDALAAIYGAEAGQDMALAVELAVQAILQMPQFLYRPELNEAGDGSLSPYELATRISYLVWSSIPT